MPRSESRARARAIAKAERKARARAAEIAERKDCARAAQNAERRARTAALAEMAVIEIDGLPYLGIAWLEACLYREHAREARWRQEARSVATRTDAKGIALHTAYLWHCLHASYRAERWRRNLAWTLAAIQANQRSTRTLFGSLVRERRNAAALMYSDLARRAGVDPNTIRHLEEATFPPSKQTLERILGVSELGLSWQDVNTALLEANPADGRKRKARKAGISRAKYTDTSYKAAEYPDCEVVKKPFAHWDSTGADRKEGARPPQGSTARRANGDGVLLF